MKKIVLTAAAALLVAGCANTQNQGYQQGYYVPADAQAAGVTAVDAQIETVRANYEDVKAQAQAQIDARKKAEAAAAKKKAQAAAAAAKAKAAQQAKINKRNEEKAELQMELLRLDVQKKKAQVGADAAMSNATAERAKDFVDNQVEEGRAKIDQIKAQSEAIRAGTAK